MAQTTMIHPALTIAFVGFTSPQDDAHFLADAYQHLGITKDSPRPTLDLIGLDMGKKRDFLAETKTYDVVVLCMIFRYRPEELKQWEKRCAAPGEICETSPLHSKENWRNRLLATRASTILCFEYMAEVGYEYLGDIPGFTVHRNEKRMMTIYQES